MSLTDDDIDRVSKRVVQDLQKCQIVHCDFDERIRPKLEAVFGIDCTDVKARENMRKRMEFLDAVMSLFQRAVWTTGFIVIVAAIFGVLLLGGLGSKSSSFMSIHSP
jgi:hypothetical protein